MSRPVPIHEYGLMVQTERPLHEPASSYVDLYEGNGKGDLGRAILGWWRDLGNDPSFFGTSARRRAQKEAREMIRRWEEVKAHK